MNLLDKCIHFLKLAQKEPSFDPEEIDFHSDPGDDYEYSKMEGLPNSDVGSNYGKLTEPLPEFSEDEMEVVGSQIEDLKEQVKAHLTDIEDKLYNLTHDNNIDKQRFAINARQNLIENISSIILSFEKITFAYVDKKQIEDVISDLKSIVRNIGHIRYGLRAMIEKDREFGVNEFVSGVSRQSDRLYEIGLKILKSISSILASSRVKYLGKGEYGWK